MDKSRARGGQRTTTSQVGLSHFHHHHHHYDHHHHSYDYDHHQQASAQSRTSQSKTFITEMVQYKEGKDQVNDYHDHEDENHDFFKMISFNDDDYYHDSNRHHHNDDQMLEPTDGLPVTGAETAANH